METVEFNLDICYAQCQLGSSCNHINTGSQWSMRPMWATYKYLLLRMLNILHDSAFTYSSHKCSFMTNLLD